MKIAESRKSHVIEGDPSRGMIPNRWPTTSMAKSRVVATALLIGCSLVHALTPVTPRLTAESRQQLLARLTETGFPEVGQNSVLIALTGALGVEARENVYLYDTPYPHLPKVEARSTPHSPGCAEVALVATYEAPATPQLTRLQGIYCLVGPAQWQAREQTLS